MAGKTATRKKVSSNAGAVKKLGTDEQMIVLLGSIREGIYELNNNIEIMLESLDSLRDRLP